MKMKTRREKIVGDCQIVGLPCYLFMFLQSAASLGGCCFSCIRKELYGTKATSEDLKCWADLVEGTATVL